MDRHFMMGNGYDNTGHSFNVFDGFGFFDVRGTDRKFASRPAY